MKPGKIAFGIAGIAILTTLGLYAKDKIATRQEYANISNLLSHYKASGIPTNNAELFHPIPDRDNAWLDIKPILLVGSSYKQRFRSALALSFLVGGEKRDLAVIGNYLRVNQAQRSIVEKAFHNKPNFQIPKNYDEGVMVLYPEAPPLRELSREFCLAALEAAYKNDLNGIEQNLKSALLLTKTPSNGLGLLPFLVVGSSQKIIHETALHVVEIAPESYPTVRKLIESTLIAQKYSFNLIFQSIFVGTIATARFYDIPEVENRKENFMGIQTSGASSDELMSLGSVRNGNYVPQGKRMRKYFSDLLVSWQPMLDRLQRQPASLPSYAEIEAAQRPNKTLPLNLRAVVTTLDDFDEDVYSQMKLFSESPHLYDLTWKLMDEYRARGSFPKVIPQEKLGATIKYLSSGNGFTLTVKPWSDKSSSVFQTCFPFRSSKTKSRLTDARAKIEAFAKGKIGIDGKDIK